MLNHYLVHMRNAAQRWFKFYNLGTRPHRRSYHTMASDGTRVFVLGGSSPGARSDEISLINVFDTSMYFRSVISSGQPPRLRTQSTSSTRNPSVTLLILMRRPPSLRRSYPQVPRPRSNHSTLNPPHQSTIQSLRHIILLLKEKLEGWRWNGSCRQHLLA
jgi:hypothetical protein